MRALLVVMAAVLLAACTANQQTPTSNNTAATAQVSPAPTKPAETAKIEKPAATSQTGPAENSERPVEFTFLGIAPDKESADYRIKVNTTKPIEEVHLALKERDDKGKVLEDTTVIWQNIVKSRRQPIESGKTYEDHTTLAQGVTKAECTLKEVIFQDGTRWSAR